MRNLERLNPAAGLSGPWCNADATTSAVLEAISFATPVLEKFFIRTIAAALAVKGDAALDRRCRAFMREEAEHTRAHRKLNAALLVYLGAPPPGLALVEKLLACADKRLPLSHRIAHVATLEHFAAVLSKRYLERQTAWEFGCDYARELFVQHAHEEIAHRSVVFDLWYARGGGGCIARALVVAAILLVGTAYLGMAVPWILQRKRNGNLIATLADLVWRKRAAPAPLRDLFLFARGDFHPQCLVAEDTAHGRHTLNQRNPS